MIVLPNRIKKTDVRQYNIIAYDEDNVYPQRVEAIINNSGTATLCADWYMRFIIGQGFADGKLSKVHVNAKGLTWDAFFVSIIKQYSKFNSFAFAVNVDFLGNIISVYPVPFDHVRLGMVKGMDYEWDGTFRVYNNWDRRISRQIKIEDIDTLYPFTTDFETMLGYIEHCGGWDNFTGMLYYHWGDDVGEYPLSKVDPELESVVTDSEIKQNSYTDVTSGLISNSIIVYPGKFEDDESRDEMEETIADGLGARGTRVKLLENPHEDKVPLKVLDLAGQNQDKRFEHTEKSVTNRIRRLYGVPPEFLDAIPGSLAGGKIGEAFDFYNEVTKPERMVFESLAEVIASNWHVPLSLDGDYSLMPLDSDKPVNEDSKTAAALQQLSPLVANKVLESMTINEIRRIATLPPIAGGDKMSKPTDEGGQPTL